MSSPLHRGDADPIDPDWLAARLSEARAVIADAAHHSDHLIRLACNVLVTHGTTAAERKEARVLRVIVDARSPHRHSRHEEKDQ